MYKGVKNGLALLSCLVVCGLFTIPGYASEYVLDSGMAEGSPAVSAWSLASDSDADGYEVATYSDAYIMPLASYGDVYDGTISSTVTNYMKGIVCRFSPSTHYVLFRESQYAYRLVYGNDLVVDGVRRHILVSTNSTFPYPSNQKQQQNRISNANFCHCFFMLSYQVND